MELEPDAEPEDELDEELEDDELEELDDEDPEAPEIRSNSTFEMVRIIIFLDEM